MSLLDMRQNIVSYLKSTFPTVKVDSHGGRMTLEEIKKWSTSSPALIVSCLGVPSVSVEGGMSVGETAWAIAVIVRVAHNNMLLRDAPALALVTPILAALPMQRWGDAASKMPKQIRAENAYSSALDSIGVALWAITWTQGVDMPEVTDPAVLADFLRAYTTYEPTDGVVSTIPAVDHQELGS